MTASSNRPPHARLFGVHAKPAGWQRIVMGALPFLLLLIVYSFASDARLADNPDDKLLPSFHQMWNSMLPMITEEDPRSGEYLLWHDTQASLTRLAIGDGRIYCCIMAGP